MTSTTSVYQSTSISHPSRLLGLGSLGPPRLENAKAGYNFWVQAMGVTSIVETSFLDVATPTRLDHLSCPEVWEMRGVYDPSENMWPPTNVIYVMTVPGCGVSFSSHVLCN